MDISNFILQKEGFLLVPSIITEPAVGYGALAAAIFFHSSYSEKHGPHPFPGLLVVVPKTVPGWQGFFMWGIGRMTGSAIWWPENSVQKWGWILPLPRKILPFILCSERHGSDNRCRNYNSILYLGGKFFLCD